MPTNGEPGRDLGAKPGGPHSGSPPPQAVLQSQTSLHKQDGLWRRGGTQCRPGLALRFARLGKHNVLCYAPPYGAGSHFSGLTHGSHHFVTHSSMPLVSIFVPIRVHSWLKSPT